MHSRLCLRLATRAPLPLPPRQAATFTTCVRRQADNPYKDIADLVTDTKSPLPDGTPIRERPASVPSDASNPYLANYTDPETGRRTQSRATPDTMTPEPAAEARSPSNVTVGRAPGQHQRQNQDPNRSGTSQLHSLLGRTQRSPTRTQPQPQSQQPVAARNRADRNSARALMNFQPRRWAVGDVYAPHDLSPAEAKKNQLARRPDAGRWERAPSRRSGPDVFDALRLDPRAEYRNMAMMAGFMTDLGRIKSRRLTGLRPKNQRRMAKAVRRAIGIGLIPSAYKHPELLEERRNSKGYAFAGLSSLGV